MTGPVRQRSPIRAHYNVGQSVAPTNNRGGSLSGQQHCFLGAEVRVGGPVELLDRSKVHARISFGGCGAPGEFPDAAARFGDNVAFNPLVSAGHEPKLGTKDSH